MKAIYFSGKAGGGKTATALGLGLKLQEKGFKVSYFKPIGFRKGTIKKDDDDVMLMRDVFCLPYSGDTISPVIVNDHYLTPRFMQEVKDLHPRIKKAFKKCSEGYDVVLIDGSIEPHVGHNQGLDDFNLAEMLGASTLQVIKADDDFDLDQNLLYLEMWKNKNIPVIGCIFNNITTNQWNKTDSVYKPLVEEKGFDVLGLIPSQVEISAPTVAEFYDVVGGDVLTAPDNMNRIVEEIVVGTMNIESALKYLRRAPNKALITGGDRSDMALTALETSTSVIILTGGLYPDLQVLSQAEEKGVPVILVHQSTYSTIENLQSIYRSIHPQNQNAINIIKDNVDQYLQWGRVVDYLQE